jgi:hypothetical protein
MKQFLPGTFLMLLLASTISRAQFTLSADVRPRAEFRNGFKRPLASEADAAFFVEQRTRLNSQFVSEKFDVYISLQDVRIWGAASQVYKADPALTNVYAAWASYKFNPTHKLVVGRMELDYDNVRILGNLDWAAQGRSHDLVKYEFQGESVKLHAGAAFNQDFNTPEPVKLGSTYYGVLNSYKAMQYLWFHKDWAKSGLSLLFLNNGASATRTTNGMVYADSTINFSQTFGVYGTKTVGDIALEYDAYYQAGKNPGGAGLAAWMIGLNATFMKSKPHNINVGFDYLSGDKSDTNKDEAFNPLYGTHHKFYGWMDYFYVGNPHRNRGLVDVFLKAKVKAGQKSSLLIHGHEFFSQSRIVANDNSNLSSTLGTEIDVVYVANLAPGVVFNLGYSHMFHTESLEFIKDAVNPKGSASWAWAMISFKPTLFTTKSEEGK